MIGDVSRLNDPDVSDVSEIFFSSNVIIAPEIGLPSKFVMVPVTSKENES